MRQLGSESLYQIVSYIMIWYSLPFTSYGGQVLPIGWVYAS
jgi:hypothetical protein